MTKVVLPHMLEQKDGSIIVVVSSVAGKMGKLHGMFVTTCRRVTLAYLTLHTMYDY